VGNAAQKVGNVVRTVSIAPVAILASKVGAPDFVKNIIQKVDPSKPDAPVQVAPAGSVIVYQDENGNVITEAEYKRRTAAIADQQASAIKARQDAAVAASLPKWTLPPTPTFTPPPPVYQQPVYPQPVYQQPSAGGGGTLLPSPQYTPAPSNASQAAAAPASGTFNPLVAGAALLAVPLVALLTGGHK
jgi:hypothetical protein